MLLADSLDETGDLSLFLFLLLFSTISWAVLYSNMRPMVSTVTVAASATNPRESSRSLIQKGNQRRMNIAIITTSGH